MRRDWDSPEREVTDEAAFENRRAFLKKLGFGVGAAAGGLGIAGWQLLGTSAPGELMQLQFDRDRSGKYPAKRNAKFKDAGRKLTAEKVAGSYNNFYEFTTVKDRVHELAKNYPFKPWKVQISGLVSKPRIFDIDQLIKLMPLEERIYRFRCVEAWAMTVPWTGFPLSALLKLVEPKSSAKYVRFVSILDKKRLPGQASGYPWPYFEALTIEEAFNPLTLMATGIYGHPLPGQHGAPIRLVLPWKYGFKSAKSIVKIELTDKRPKTFWSESSDEYGFWANINPKVDHARWSQATERLIIAGDGEQPRVATQLYNGYGAYVAKLYEKIQKTEKIWY